MILGALIKSNFHGIKSVKLISRKNRNDIEYKFKRSIDKYQEDAGIFIFKCVGSSLLDVYWFPCFGLLADLV